jgi:hypothetical protein
MRVMRTKMTLLLTVVLAVGALGTPACTAWDATLQSAHHRPDTPPPTLLPPPS